MYKKRTYIDDMVDMFGYDYVIGYCLCSSYDLNKRADREEDAGRAAKMKRSARIYADKAETLTRERIADGL